MARNYFKALKSRYKWETSSPEIITIPDQTLTIPQIMDRFRKGIPVETRQTYYSDDPINYQSLDLAELSQMSEENKQYMSDLQEELKNASEAKKATLEAKKAEDAKIVPPKEDNIDKK